MAPSGNDYNATTDATGGIFLLDYHNTASTGFAIPESYRQWEGWYYEGKRYGSYKEALAAKNKAESKVHFYVPVNAQRCIIMHQTIPKVHNKVLYIRPRTAPSRRQIAKHKRKAKLHAQQSRSVAC